MQKSRERFLSLDVFRGMTICFMIIVNTGGSGAEPFAPLEHARWHGFTPTDLVFPSFLFAVGNAMSFSMDKYRLMGDRHLWTKIIRRTLILFLLGFLMYWFPFFRLDGSGHIISAPLRNTRIMGVLQRIALCYFFAALLIHYFSARKVYIISIGILILYWLALLFFGDTNQPFSLLGNAGLYLDKFLFGNNHLYHGEGIPFDPEGILSTFPAIVNVVIGYYAGIFIKKSGKNYETLARLMLTGALLIFIALCWNMIFPINKKLWTSSFVLLTTGLDLVILSGIIYIVELRHANIFNWTKFFIIFGKNPLTIYLLSELLVTVFFMITIRPGVSFYNWINNIFFQVIAPGSMGSLLFAISYMLLCWTVGWWLNRRQHNRNSRLMPDRITS
jgi:predicted acyltransferase